MKIFRLILILALGLQIGFGEGENGSSGSGQNDNVYLKNPSKAIIRGQGQCSGSWVCNEVKDGYVTKITGYDFMLGTTYCSVFRQDDLNNPIGQANRQVESCQLSKNISDEGYKQYNKLTSIPKSTNKVESSIEYNKKQNELKMSEFIVGLLTLNPTIIDRAGTKQYGEIMFNGGSKNLFHITNIVRGEQNMTTSQYFTNLMNKVNSDFIEMNTLDGKAISSSTTNALDGFNKNNMAYFNNLFASMEKIYQHLQIFIFVLIGGFFVMQIGASKLQAYLENRGEGEGKQPYLHKFYIPLLMIGIFFMPIPEGNGYQSTVMQNMIRYFAQYSTTLADMAHSIGAKTYMDKIYKSAGGYSPEISGQLVLHTEKQKHFIKQAKSAFEDKCMYRWGDLVSSSYSNQSQTNKCRNLIMNGSDDKANIIDCDTCEKYLNDLEYAKKIYLDLQTKQDKAESFNNTYSKKLKEIDDYFTLRNNQLGLIDALLTPTSSILTETFVLAEAGLEELSKKKQREKMEQKTKEDRVNKQVAQSDGNTKEANTENEINDSLLGMISGKVLVYMMLPGAMAIKDFIYSIWGTISGVIGGIVGGTLGMPIPGAGTVVGRKIGFIIGAIIGGITKIIGPLAVIGSYYGASVLMEWTIDMIPLLAISTATLVAFISYLVSLCKYFYISPFVTAWAMATKKVDKIIDFLLAGIAIFFTPILIIVFLYLALFMHTFIEEFFVFISVEQFASIKTSIWDFHTNFIIGAISGLLKIFGMLAASYISWKLIVNGNSWALSLIGIDGKQGDMIAGGLENNLAKRAFVA